MRLSIALHLIGLALLFVVVIYVPPVLTGCILLFAVTVYVQVVRIMRDYSRRPVIYDPTDDVDSAM